MQRVIMGNRQVDVLSRGKDDLRLALELLSNGNPLTHYVEEDGQLVLCWGRAEGSKELLFPLRSADEMTEFAWGWIKNKAEHKERYPEGDVTNEEGGFRAWSGPWGHDERYHFGFARVEARFVWIGK